MSLKSEIEEEIVKGKRVSEDIHSKATHRMRMIFKIIIVTMILYIPLFTLFLFILLFQEKIELADFFALLCVVGMAICFTLTTIRLLKRMEGIFVHENGIYFKWMRRDFIPFRDVQKIYYSVDEELAKMIIERMKGKANKMIINAVKNSIPIELSGDKFKFISKRKLDSAEETERTLKSAFNTAKNKNENKIAGSAR